MLVKIIININKENDLFIYYYYHFLLFIKIIKDFHY